MGYITYSFMYCQEIGYGHEKNMGHGQWSKGPKDSQHVTEVTNKDEENSPNIEKETCHLITKKFSIMITMSMIISVSLRLSAFEGKNVG